MQDEVKAVLSILKNPPHMLCISEEGATEQIHQAVHQFGTKLPARRLATWMPPSMKELFKNFNGANLFRPNDEAEAGFIFFDLEEITQEQIDLQDEFSDDAESSDNDAEELAWMAGLIPIAAPFCSGDRFALDTYNRRSDGECPVIFIGHEMRHGGPLLPSDVDEVAVSYLTFFSIVVNDPLAYITKGWTDEVSNRRWQISGLVSHGKSREKSKTKLSNSISVEKLELGLLECKNVSFEVGKVSLMDLEDKGRQFEKTACVRFLVAPLLEGRLSIVRVLAPEGLRFCDVGIYWSWINSVTRWSASFSKDAKKIIRQEQKKAGWKSDAIYHDGPSFSLSGRAMDFYVCTEDIEIPIDYVKSQVRFFPQAFMLNDVWEFKYMNNQRPEAELVELVSDSGQAADVKCFEKLLSVCRDLEKGNPHPIRDELRVRPGLVGIFSVGPDYTSNKVLPHHVLRAHLLRLLAWPKTIVIARAELRNDCEDAIIDYDGVAMSWRTELSTFVEETLKKYPFIDTTYVPTKDVN
ncbi:hypothetical protein UNDKW_4337 [Undibacterium sp. KW1]|nr:hypothetical protein UNDKW_4337 [Undibacterium sp. KW1]